MSKNTKKTISPKRRFPDFIGTDKWNATLIGNIIIQHNEKTTRNKQYPVLTSSRSGIMFQSDYYNNRDVASEDTTGYNVVPRGFFTYRHMSDDLVFKFNINDICDNGIVSTLYPVFTVKDWIVPSFLKEVLNEGEEFRHFAFAQKQGGGRTYMYLNKLKDLAIYLPSHKEQQKIADCLSSIDDLINAQSQKVEALKTHKKGLMQQLFPREGETVPRLRFPEFRDAGEWEVKPLGSIGINLDSKRVPITESERIKGAVPYYGASGIIDYVKDFIFDEELLCISEDGANLIARTYPIAFSITGKTWVNNHAHVLKFEYKQLQVIVENYLNAINLEDYLTGMAQPKLNRAKLDIIPIPLPEKDEQKAIADCLSNIDNLINAQSQKLESFKSHKKGLMQQLFPTASEV